ncbi:triose-phosphate isomerase [Suttonella ornithocola]|uniref:Triosephosphate isomerase n=1 Tax=Suttonella ornithocola TaxID=279832 RepID=A0A380MRI5_9GAMM|nr:triose-phosphate isomerase [Suttonella ornithocola]SUO94523.1 Triosephosphate isomerase [Suttonella ornithocola]
MRKPIAAANWKMNGSLALLQAFEQAKLGADSVQTIWGLPAVFLHQAHAAGLKDLAGEDVSAHEKGAYTGEISAEMLKEAGCRYCIIGHSERREMHGEDETLLQAKWEQLKAQGIIPVYCLGESEAEYDNGETQAAIERQLAPMLDAGLVDENTVIAYEPVWAIGTGKAATPEYAQKVHEQIRQMIAAKCANIADKVRILYGGSVKPENAGELIAKADIDGFLVGGASLQVDAFGKIIEAIS